ncbi:MAG TPA: BlaI/MecI/CopY family transcriptional regulator [Pseudobacteroides sp.]|nr:BlaI/MecI/CopY family transcriptional regulator [Pseudobacteroides sp.]
MSKLQRMSDAEREVMQLVWAAGRSVSSAKLLNDLKAINKEWKPNTVLTFLARLIEKGILTSVRHGRSNEYIPLITESEYKQFETRTFLNSVHDGSVKSFITALYEGNDLTAEEISELKQWFSQKEVEE